MLSAEQVDERLKAVENPKYMPEQIKRVVRLPRALAAIGQVLMQAGPYWEGLAKKRKQGEQEKNNAIKQLAVLKVGGRLKLFEALFPKLSPYVEATWNLFDILPYQVTYHRRPFRILHQFPAAQINWLFRLIQATKGYDQDIAWFAAWAPYLGYYAPDAIGYLCAGAIEAGGKTGQEVFEILAATAQGSHEIGVMGRHVVRGLLCASRREGWELMERMLVAAQREEGLRQVILESVDEAQPQAFRRMLHLILEHNLTRFSAAIRACDVWFGLALETVSQKAVNEILASVARYLDEPAERETALREGSAQEAYYALWAMAFEDALVALPHAIAMRQSSDPERRFAATHLLAQLILVDSFNELLNALEDPDLRIAARAVENLTFAEYDRSLLEQSDLFERVERLVVRLPHKATPLKPLVWDWVPLTLDRGKLAGRLIDCLGERSPQRLFPHLPGMEPEDRSRVASLLKESSRKDAETRQVFLTLAGDPSPSVRAQALAALQDFRLAEQDAEQMEGLLTRKADDLRRGVIRLLLGLPDEALLKSSKRLLEQKDGNQRRAGLELLRESYLAGRNRAECRRLASQYPRGADMGEMERHLLEDILGEEIEQVTLEDALGLMDPQNRTRPAPPRKDKALIGGAAKTRLGSQAAVEMLKSLDDLVDEHRAEPVRLAAWQTERTELLGNIRYGFPDPDPSQPLVQDLERLPLREVWETWWSTRPAAQRDADRFELCRALAILQLVEIEWSGFAPKFSVVPGTMQKFFDIRADFKLRYKAVVDSVVRWMIWAHPAQGESTFLVDALEASLSRIPEAELIGVKQSYGNVQYRPIPPGKLAYLDLCRWHRNLQPGAWQEEHHVRLWAAARWLDEPKPGLPRFYPQLEDALFAQRAGGATRDDLLDLLIGARVIGDFRHPFDNLRRLSGRKPHPYLETFPILKELVDACRERIIAVEIRRGDLPTAATAPAAALRSVPGMETLFRLLVALGKANLDRGAGIGRSRQEVLSRLIRVTYPVVGDTPEGFAEMVKANQISARRLVELAVFAPQWAGYVEAALNRPRLREAVFWVYAHTKDRHWAVENEIRDLWAAQVSEYTPLSADSLMDGAVDVAWFHQAYAALGDGQWQEVYRAAELIATGSGHVRARIFADAMLGKLSAEHLTERITQKRHQDSLRALGLVPLPADEKRQAEVLRRYETMQDFLRTGKKFGSQRQASEKLAAAIGMENLARTAGYPDPQRLEWAMEIEAVADLADGPAVAEAGGIRVVLAIDELGEPGLAVSKNGKELKAIPASAKKEAQIAGLVERKQKLSRQVSRMRQSLEGAMCRGDTFSGAEIQTLFRHPMLRAMLEQLVFAGPAGMGYPTADGKELWADTGSPIPLKPDDLLHIAHPVDLLESGDWHRWQHECFIAERIQPFKQVFRELYSLTAAEKEEGNLSRRYAGQQVNPRQALALFGARGWVMDPEEGVHKTFHSLGLSARVGFLQRMFTPAEVEGLTLDTVLFTPRGEWSPLPLETIAPRVFSEVMRDLDLVVSVAHAGGVDPEASASSMESRTALIQETCNLLQLPNVQLKERHAVITGKLGNYTVHLGSAVVHKQPGGSLCIIPVHSQHRGRLFLPFADQDPKSAEVVSKVILLAKDSEIRDPTILEQILN